jgi:hypothetical protein
MEEVRKCLGCGKELTVETAALWVEGWAMCSECETKAEAMYDALSPEEQEAEDRRVGASW